MRILIVTDSFKENLTATAVATAISKGILKIDKTVIVQEIPFSDGGEGALDVLNQYAKGKIIHYETQDALGNQIVAPYFLFEDKKTAWIELSQASGLAQIPKNLRNVLKASTYGTGLLIKNALSKGCTHIILGVGGSATNDAASGIFQALGGKLIDANKNELGVGGGNLSSLQRIVRPTSISSKIKWSVASDVNNCLLGENGAAKTYAPQKGATAKEVEILETALSHFSEIVKHMFGRDITKVKGGGAAGGVAAGMKGFFNASIESGFDLISKMIPLELSISKADLIFTAEGKMDAQSINGKLTVGVARLGKKHGVPVIGLAGNIEPPYRQLYKEGFSGIFAIQNGPVSLEDSKKFAPELLHDSASRIFNLYKNLSILS